MPSSRPAPDPAEEDTQLVEASQRLAERCRDGDFVDPETLLQESPDHAEELLASLPAMRLLSMVASDPLADSGLFPVPPAPTLNDEFTDLREIGRGGMGVVFEAFQVSLNRRVALKFLPAAAALDPRLRKRFLREALATSRLEHDHIVPVIAVDLTGPTPYYAMKYVAGCSLADVVREFRRREQPSGDEARPGTRIPDGLIDRLRAIAPPSASARPGASCGPSGRTRPSFEAVARIGLQTAKALDHAHQNDVIHGDVKPGNLLIDARANVWLADFGLAVLKDPEGTRTTSPAGGTIGYMSPEQAEPNGPPIDARSDLYSLGATLYELATLRRPPQPDGPADAGAPPLRLEKNARDLETIILKAMRPAVSERYASAAAMAEDLERFLRREPILATRATIRDRLGKWAIRHRRGLSAWCATVALVLIALTCLLALAHRREVALRSRAEEWVVAMRGLVQHTTLAVEDLTEAVPIGSDRLHSFYERMQRFYEDVLKSVPGAIDDPEFRFRAALANFHLARSWNARGENPRKDSIRCLDRSIQLLEPLASAFPERVWYRYDLFRSLSSRSRSLLHTSSPTVNTDRLVRSEKDATAALGVIEALASEHPENPDWEDAVAFQNYQIARFLLSRGRVDEAERHGRRCLSIAERVSVAHPDRPMYLHNIQRAWHLIADIARSRGRIEEALASLRRSIEIHEQVSSRGPDQLYYPFERFILQQRLGDMLTEAGRLDEADATLQDALIAADRMRQTYQYRIDLINSVADIRRSMVRLRQRQGRDAEADSLLQEIRRIFTDAIAASPESSDLRHTLEAELVKFTSPQPSGEEGQRNAP